LQDSPVTAVAEYIVEPRRLIDHVRGSIPSQPIGPHGEYEAPLLRPFPSDGSDNPELFRFLLILDELFVRWDSPVGRKEQKTLDRLHRSADRFLNSGPLVDIDGDVLMPHERPNVLLGYVSALENLLTADDEEPLDLRRRTSHRAAVLIGRDDQERSTVHQSVFEAYGVRNKIAHGSVLNAGILTKSTRAIRPILRQALTAAVVLGPSVNLAELCDKALLSHGVLKDRIRSPLDSFLSL
jgi:hypothetical protein